MFEFLQGWRHYVGSDYHFSLAASIHFTISPYFTMCNLGWDNVQHQSVRKKPELLLQTQLRCCSSSTESARKHSMSLSLNSASSICWASHPFNEGRKRLVIASYTRFHMPSSCLTINHFFLVTASSPCKIRISKLFLDLAERCFARFKFLIVDPDQEFVRKSCTKRRKFRLCYLTDRREN